MIIAIDGPAGAGKSSVAKEFAKRSGYIYIDTGAMYRALTWKALENDKDVKNSYEMKELLNKSTINLVHSNEEMILKIFIDDIDITTQIREPRVSNNVSLVAEHREVREIMVDKQRVIGHSKNGVVMDGRDIGTVVFPDADVKIFFTASVEERARRRFKEQIEKGITTNIDDLIKEISLRDKTDMNRAVAPLKPADDAIILDTTELTYEEVINKLTDITNKVIRIKENSYC
jgi:cytidylate kinase